MCPSVWIEDHQPTPSEVVLLSDVHQKQRGWRAERAVAKRPEIKRVIEIELAFLSRTFN